MRNRILAAVVTLVAAGSSRSQDIPVAAAPQERLTSPDGKLTLVADYTDQSWTLLEGDPPRVRWRRDYTGQDSNPEPMPKHARLNVDGWIVASVWPHATVIVEPSRGRTVMKFRVLEQLSRQDYRRYVDDQVMDAPPQWGEAHALRGFFRAMDEPFYTVRTWWGRRFIIDLNGARFVPDEGPVHDACVAAERDRVMADLRAAVHEGPPVLVGERSTWPAYFRVRRAAHMAGLFELREALPLLRALERWEYIDSTGGRGGGPPYVGRLNAARQFVQLSIRRLGETPEALPVYRFPREEPAAAEGGLPAVLASASRERARSAPEIRPGMTGARVVGLIGTPDAMYFNRKHRRDDWEYDFDAEDPFSLRIAWDGETVAEVEVIRPARWKQGLARDEQLLGHGR
ncbi:MAG: hypothetical protein ACKVU4_12930 [Phycisphaerales bacterium]